MTVTPATLSLANEEDGVITVSNAAGTLTVTSDNEDVTAVAAPDKSKVTVTMGENATEGATITITDGYETCKVTVTLKEETDGTEE